MRGCTESDGAKERDVQRSRLARNFARYGSAGPLLLVIAAGCAAQDAGDMPSDGDTSSGGKSAGGSSAGKASGGSVSSAGSTSNGGTTSLGGGGSNASGSATGGTATGGTANGGSVTGGTASGGTASGGTATGGSAGSGGSTAGTGGKAAGGSGGTGGSAGASGSGGTAVDACMNKTKDANETDVDCGGVCAAKCAVNKGCAHYGDCQAGNVCDTDKCRATGCTAINCADALTHYVIGARASGQAVVSWDATSLKVSFQIDDATPEDDSDNNWEDDSVEVYLDLNHDQSTTYGTDDFQLTIPRNAGTLSGGTGVGGNLNYAGIVVSNRVSNAQGYSLDVSIPWTALDNATFPSGKTIGFDLGVNDDTNGGTRDGQSILYGDLNDYQNTSKFGTLTLTP